jgi:predicted CoA-substrate-specific enzyme activase
MSKYYVGIDVGSWNTKVVVVDDTLEILGKSVVRSGADLLGAAKKAYEEALKAAKLKKAKVESVVATGFGRAKVPFADTTRTEITCHGLGANQYYPASISVVDIGGQDTKLIRVDDTGRNLHFVLNRKCAAGTGAFLEEMARRLDVKLDDLNDLASRATKHFRLGSFCTVFTGTEVLKMVQDNEKVENIARGLYASVVLRVSEMGHLEGHVVLTGGVIAHNPILKDIFEEELKIICLVPPEAEFIGALGATRVALGLDDESAKKKKKEKSKKG